ncbi:Eukaryotic translation initiation factor 2-alpha kinase 3 [Chionoecetes opilio]|uniref:non-specific serine/threonine protein kinase n=1 Tax=Chionoecetes opilio TaxID=41210 RepID=A0A8J5D5V5_CHIOP|nr:Eukaryotic translation initiation factor 2-alpha kinase 3 [Chionoecetes opilio]
MGGLLKTRAPAHPAAGAPTGGRTGRTCVHCKPPGIPNACITRLYHPGVAGVCCSFLLYLLLHHVLLLLRTRHRRELVLDAQLFTLILQSNPQVGDLTANGTPPPTTTPTTTTRGGERGPTTPTTATTTTTGGYQTEFEMVQRLGRGGFGVVYQVRDKLDKKEYAVKRINLPSKDIFTMSSPYSPCSEEYPSEAPEPTTPEKRPLDSKGLSGDLEGLGEGLGAQGGVTRERDSSFEVVSEGSEGSPANPRTLLYIKLELCHKEVLRDWLMQNGRSEKKEVLDMFSDIINAVEYIHDQNLMHRDLKVKVGDFGLVTTIAEEEEDQTPFTPTTNRGGVLTHRTHTHDVGTRFYMSPEQLSGQAYDNKVDIYSLGLIFFEMLVPFGTDMERCKVMTRLREDLVFPPKFKEDFPDENSLLRLMLSRDPAKRPTTREIRDHKPLRSLKGHNIGGIIPEDHFSRSSKSSRHKSCLVSTSSSFSPSLPFFSSLLNPLDSLMRRMMSQESQVLMMPQDPERRPTTSNVVVRDIVRCLRGHTIENIIP